MKKRRVIAVITIFASLPGFWGAFFLTSWMNGISVVFLLAMLALFCRGLSGLFGGILIWRGYRIGYQLTLVCWSYLVAVGCFTLIEILYVPDPISFEVTPENRLFMRQLGNALGKLLWGIPIILIMLRDLKVEVAAKPIGAN